LTFGLPFIIYAFMDLSIIHDRQGFRLHVADALGRVPLDYLAELEFIETTRGGLTIWAAGAVLLPLYFREETGSHAPGNYVLLLNKRSRQVQQPGDLCAPGGGIHPRLDRLLGRLLRSRFLSGIGGLGLAGETNRGDSLYEKISLLLATALRESWEELRLSPFNVEYLGPLPAYRLHQRSWTIFPMVGGVRHNWKPKLSWEVEKIVSIPLQSFFRPENYALYSLEVPEHLVSQGIPNPWRFPCLVHQDNGEEEILWGATFEVVENFFKIVLDFDLPTANLQRIIERPLASNYLSGREPPVNGFTGTKKS
jgi:8-oxo-dGTP pyrophosphatase MutT (NUDIX family)